MTRKDGALEALALAIEDTATSTTGFIACEDAETLMDKLAQRGFTIAL